MPRPNDTKVCTRCKRELPFEDFDRYLFQGQPHIYKRMCRSCDAIRLAVPPIQLANPSGLCMCGCGEPAPIATLTNRKKRQIAGQPMRFIPHHQNRKSLIEYVIDEATGCWVWQQGKSSAGYGMKWIEVDGAAKRVYAHRLFYERDRGPIPKGMELDHLCRNRGCCNPAHLEVVTKVENIRRGIRIKLSSAIVAEIRALWPGVSTLELADRFEVHADTIRCVLKGKTWKS
jgi:hypothetical protein